MGSGQMRQTRSDHVRSDQTRPGQIMSGQIRPDQARPNQIRSGQARSGQLAMQSHVHPIASVRAIARTWWGPAAASACGCKGLNLAIRTPYRFCRNRHAGKARHSEKAQQRRCQSTQSRPIELVISLWFGGAQKNQNGKRPIPVAGRFLKPPGELMAAGIVG